MNKGNEKNYIFGIRPIIEAIESGKTIDLTEKGKEIRRKYLGDLDDKNARTRVCRFCSIWTCWESQKIARNKDTRPLTQDKNKTVLGKNKFCDGRIMRKRGNGENWKKSSNTLPQLGKFNQSP